MVERYRQAHQERITEEQFDLERTLIREKRQDLLILEPGQTLTLRDRLRRKRQLELAEQKYLSDNYLSHPMPITLQQRRKEYLLRQYSLDATFQFAIEGYEGLLTEEELRVVKGDYSILPERTPQTRRIWHVRANARKKIEINKLEPSHIYPLGKLATSHSRHNGHSTITLSNAVLRKVLPAVFFLNKNYSMQQHVDWMERTKKGHLDEQQVKQGLIGIREAFSENDYIIIKKSQKYAQYLQEHNGVLYVTEDSIEELLSILHPPNENYLPLSQFASSKTEKDRLKAAIRKGRLEGLLIRGQLLTTKEAISAYEESVPDTYKKRRKGVRHEELEK